MKNVTNEKPGAANSGLFEKNHDKNTNNILLSKHNVNLPHSSKDVSRPLEAQSLEITSPPLLSPLALPAGGILKQIVELATRSSEADPAAVLATILTRFAAEIGANPHFKVGDATHFVRFFVAIVGSTSKARKGTSGSCLKSLFEDSVINCTGGPLSTGEGLAYAVRDEVKAWKSDNKGGGSWITVDPGIKDKRLFVLDEEMGAGIRCTKREGNTLSMALRSFWDHGNFSPLIKRDRTTTTNAHICLCTHITVEELKSTLPEIEGFTGYSNRFLWVFARRQKLVPMPCPMPENEVEAARSDLRQLVEHARTVGRMQMSARATEFWVGIYPQLSNDGYGLAGAVTSRAEAQVIRISMAYALLDGSINIDLPHLMAAVAFWQYCEDTAMYIFGNNVADPVQMRILEGLKSKPLTTTEISKQIFKNNLKSAQLQKALSELTQKGLLICSTETTEGRNRNIYSLSLMNKK
ncbi:winged helix-turn-helix domain-containing protein [Desulfonatronum parangueonense]